VSGKAGLPQSVPYFFSDQLRRTPSMQIGAVIATVLASIATLKLPLAERADLCDECICASNVLAQGREAGLPA